MINKIISFFKDKRDGKVYGTVKIGCQTWMAENLAYNADGSMYYNDYNNDKENLKIYGRLYSWSTAMDFPSKCNNKLSKSDEACTIKTPHHQGICPDGWHIPSKDDWDILIKYIQNDNNCTSCDAKHLKATNVWNGGGGGQNTYGFCALPGGEGRQCRLQSYTQGVPTLPGGGDPDFDLFDGEYVGFPALPEGDSCSCGYFSNIGEYGKWWTSKEISDDGAYCLCMSYNNDASNFGNELKSNLLSVRCVKD